MSGSLALDALLERAKTCPELEWLAGLMEGEGSFFPGSPSEPRSPVMQVAMIDGDVIERVARLLGVSALPVRPQNDAWQPTFVARVRGAPAVAWMTALRPLMGHRRRLQIDRALASYAPRSTRRLDNRRARWALAELDSGSSVKDVAARLRVSQWCTYDLRLGRTHKHLGARAVSHEP